MKKKILNFIYSLLITIVADIIMITIKNVLGFESDFLIGYVCASVFIISFISLNNINIEQQLASDYEVEEYHLENEKLKTENEKLKTENEKLKTDIDYYKSRFENLKSDNIINDSIK
jgi:uncharacterized protein YsxB (DUF464 family)